MSSETLPAPKSDFIGLDGKVHLATGGEPPLLVAHRQAFERFAADKANGFEGYHTHWRVIDEVRHQLAGLTGIDGGDIALVGNASEGIEKVISSLDWRRGGNVVAPELDFASGRYALANLQRHGIELRLVPADGWHICTDALLDACDDDTRLLYVSQVNALTGQHLDIESLSHALAPRPTVFLVDASHAMGVVPVNGTLCDFLVSCCYKFLLGVHEGVLTWNRQRRPDFVPSGVGWWSADRGAHAGQFNLKPDAKRVEYGNVGHLGAYLLRESLAYLERFGIEAIAAHTRALSGRMVAGMHDLGLDVMTPSSASERAGNAAFAWPDCERVVRKAAEENVFVSGDNARVRASAHLFTTAEDVEIFLRRLPAFLA